MCWGRCIRDSNVSPAEQRLLRLLRLDWLASPDVEDDPGPIADWGVIVERALHHGVAPLLCRRLIRRPPPDAPSDVIAAAAVYLESVEKQGAARLAQLIEVLAALERDGVEALPFKGPVLGVAAHASATLRESRDLDVLVRRQDMAAAVASLRRLGYRPEEEFNRRITEACYDSYGQEILFAPGRLPVEPHWTFTPRGLAAEIDMEGIWSRACPIELAGRQVRSLSREDTLFVACLHGSKEKWWRLLWVADVAAFLCRHPAIDWTTVASRAESHGLRRMWLLGLALARELFGAEIPPSLTSSIDRDAACGDLLRASLHNLFAASVDVGSVHWISRYHLRARERYSDRVRYVLRSLATPQAEHYRMISLPPALTPAYSAVKILHDYAAKPLWIAFRRIAGRNGDSEVPGSSA
ncbi:MAG TPA: nucleotidyltransferase family protein [Casimicrobiaceae bacterium]|nr:nucleotidyltransferase family protein [Casimicrobiaceae bacterium]